MDFYEKLRQEVEANKNGEMAPFKPRKTKYTSVSKQLENLRIADEKKASQYDKMKRERITLRNDALIKLGYRCNVCDTADLNLLEIACKHVLSEETRASEWAKLALIARDYKGAASHYILLCVVCKKRDTWSKSLEAYDERSLYQQYKSERMSGWT